MMPLARIHPAVSRDVHALKYLEASARRRARRKMWVVLLVVAVVSVFSLL